MKQNNLFELNDHNIEELNISKCLTLKRCPFEYKMRYIEKNSFKWQPNVVMNHGILLHEIFSLFYKNKLMRENNRLIYELFDERWEKERDKFVNHEDEYYAKCKNAIKLFMNNPISKLVPVASEYKFRRIIKDNLYITGRIDLIGKTDSTIQIWDFKLEKAEFLLGEEDHKKYFQLIFYYFGLGDIFGFVPNILGYYFCSGGESISIKVSPELLRKGFQEIENAVTEMNNMHEFLPRINNYCPSCGFDYVCPKFTNKKGGA